MNEKIKYAALYVHSRSNYKKYPEFDCYDEKRNALNFDSMLPVIAHPPCRLYSRLRRFSNADEAEKEHAHNSLKIVRKNGGIFEHPASSKFWKVVDIIKPGRTDSFGGFTVCIDQSWFGYYTQKRTLLYICGMEPDQLPRYPIKFNASVRKFDNLTPKQRSETTDEMILWILSCLKIIEQNKKVPGSK